MVCDRVLGGVCELWLCGVNAWSERCRSKCLPKGSGCDYARVRKGTLPFLGSAQPLLLTTQRKLPMEGSWMAPNTQGLVKASLCCCQKDGIDHNFCILQCKILLQEALRQDFGR